MSVLGRATRRDLARQRWQYLSVGIIVALGVALFAASYDAFLNLESSYEQTYDRLAFADLVVTGGKTDQFAEQATQRPGVGAVTTRRQADIPIRISGDHTFMGRVVELPDDASPEVDKVDVLDGSVPDVSVQKVILAERHMADHFDLGPGATIELNVAGAWRTLDIAAVVASPEYIWPARSRQDLLASPDDFGVIFAPKRTFDSIVTDAAAQVLVRYDADADPDALTAVLTDDAQAAGVATIELRADQPSNAALQEDVAGFGELSLLFPVLFLSTAAMATFILLSRLVRTQQAHIATLSANGMSSGQITRHYLGQGFLVTMIAGVIGLIVGVAAGRLVTGLYTDAITVPDTVTDVHLSTVITGLVLAALTGSAAAALPAIAAGRTLPAAALRGSTPALEGGRSIVERLVPPIRRLPARWRAILRGVGRDRRRSLSTAGGVVLALTLILTSWGMVDTVEILLDRQFTEIQRQDAQLYIDPTVDGTIDEVSGTAGVERTEPVIQASVVVSSDSGHYATELIAFQPDSQMHDFGDVGPPQHGLVAGRSLAEELGIDVGDVVTVATTSGSEPIEVDVEGFVDEPLGTFVYTDLATARPLAAASDPTSIMLRFSTSVDRAEMRQSLTRRAGVVAYVDSRALYDTAQNMLSLFYAFVGIMLAFGCLMAFALIFNTTTVNASERSAELAAMKVNGMSSGQLARLLAGENMLLSAIAILPGLVIGYAVSAFFMDSFSSDLFDFGLQMRGRTLVLSAAAILVVSAIAQWPATRLIASLDVSRVVRERSG